MTATTVTLSPTDRDRLEQCYIFTERSQVLKFLEKCPALISILLEAPDKIYRYFPQNTPLILEVEIDPESSASDEEELTLLIAAELDPDESIERLWQLDKDFKSDAIAENKEKFLINIGY